MQNKKIKKTDVERVVKVVMKNRLIGFLIRQNVFPSSYVILFLKKKLLVHKPCDYKCITTFFHSDGGILNLRLVRDRLVQL